MYNVKPQASYRLTTRTNETKPSCKTRLQNQAPLFKQYSQQKFVCKYSSKTTKIHSFYENNNHWAEKLLANPMIWYLYNENTKVWWTKSGHLWCRDTINSVCSGSKVARSVYVCFVIFGLRPWVHLPCLSRLHARVMYFCHSSVVRLHGYSTLIHRVGTFFLFVVVAAFKLT